MSSDNTDREYYSSSVSDRLGFWNKQQSQSSHIRPSQPLVKTSDQLSTDSVSGGGDAKEDVTTTTTTVQYLNTPSRSKISFNIHDTTPVKQPTVETPIPPPQLSSISYNGTKRQGGTIYNILKRCGLERMTATYWVSFLLVLSTFFIIAFVLSRPAGILYNSDGEEAAQQNKTPSNHSSKRELNNNAYDLGTFSQRFKQFDDTLRLGIKPLPSLQDAEDATKTFHDLRYPKAICSFCDYSHMNVTLSEYVRLTKAMYRNDDEDVLCSQHFVQSPFRNSDNDDHSHPYSKYPYTTSSEGSVASLNMCGLSHDIVVDEYGEFKPSYGHLSLKPTNGDDHHPYFMAEYVPNNLIVADLRFMDGEWVEQPSECQLWHMLHVPPFLRDKTQSDDIHSYTAERWDKGAYSYFDWTLEGNEVFALSSELDATNQQVYEEKRNNNPYWSFGRWVKESVGKKPALSVWNIKREFYEYWNTSHTAAQLHAAISGKFVLQAILLIPMTGYNVDRLMLEVFTEEQYINTNVPSTKEFPIPLPPIIRISEHEAFVPVHVTFDENEFKSWNIPNDGILNSDYTIEFHPRSTNLNHQHTLDDNSMGVFYWKCRTALYDMLTQSSRFYKFGV